LLEKKKRHHHFPSIDLLTTLLTVLRFVDFFNVHFASEIKIMMGFLLFLEVGGEGYRKNLLNVANCRIV